MIKIIKRIFDQKMRVSLDETIDAEGRSVYVYIYIHV